MKSILATVLIAKVENLDDDFVRSDLLARNVDSRYLHTSLSRVHYEKKIYKKFRIRRKIRSFDSSNDCFRNNYADT